MTVRYHHWLNRLIPQYVCQRERVQREQPVCQVIRGTALDAAIGELLVGSMTPLSLETTLAIQAEVEARDADADRLRRQHVEHARHEAEVAQYRFLRVHPDNRLVADALEAEWNARLRELGEAHETYERQRATAQQALDAEQRAAIINLSTMCLGSGAILARRIANASGWRDCSLRTSPCSRPITSLPTFASRVGRHRGLSCRCHCRSDCCARPMRRPLPKSIVYWTNTPKEKSVRSSPHATCVPEAAWHSPVFAYAGCAWRTNSCRVTSGSANAVISPDTSSPLCWVLDLRRSSSGVVKACYTVKPRTIVATTSIHLTSPSRASMPGSSVIWLGAQYLSNQLDEVQL